MIMVLAYGVELDVGNLQMGSRCIQDHETFGDSYQAATGIAHILVGSRFVIRNGELVGKELKATRAGASGGSGLR